MSYDAQTNAWNPYLTDFDLAWFSTATLVTRKLSELCSMLHRSKLQNPLRRSLTPRTTDVFSFGQLLFYALTGSDPVSIGASGQSPDAWRKSRNMGK